MPNFKSSDGYQMKNSTLRKGSMHKTPMQMNYGSPAKDYSVTKGSHAHKMGSPMDHAKFGDPHGPEKNHSGTPEAHSSDGANPIQPEPKKTKKKNSSLKQTTGRENKIAKNTEFNTHARETGILPNFTTTKEKEKFYSNKANVNMLNKKQKEYFKNKK